MNAPLVAVPAELERAASETGLHADGVQSLKAGFAPHFVRFHELVEQARAVADDQPKAARAMRLELKSVRVAAEKTRKELKEDSLRRGKAIDGINALLNYQLAPIEERLEKIEKAEEIREAQRRAALHEARLQAIRPYVDEATISKWTDLSVMPESIWSAMLEVAIANQQAKAAEALRAEADRVAAERAAEEARANREAEQAVERARLRKENERLQKIAEEERRAREEADAERRKAAAIAEAQAREERQKREAVEAELRAQREKQARAEEEKRTAAKRAAAAPDREKLYELAETVRSIVVPSFDSENRNSLRASINHRIDELARSIEEDADKLNQVER